MSPTIPTINLSLSRLAVVEFIRTACLTHGFFQIVSHQFPPLLRRDVFEYSRRLFALPTAEKIRFKRPEHNYSGYEAFQSYSLQATRGTPDLNEGFGIASVFYDDASRWPAETPGNGLIGFKACCRQYHSAMEELAKTLAGYVAEGLELDKDYFEDYFFRPMTQARLIHYFVDDVQEDTDNDGKQRIGAGLHSDWGLLTVLSQDDVGGLEVYDPYSESFIPVHPVPDAFVVNVGDLLSRFTNGVYISAQHRVLAPSPGTHRYSIPFFSQGNPNYIVDVLPLSERWKEWAQGKGKCKEAGFGVRKWEPIAAGTYLAMKFQQSKDGGKQTVIQAPEGR